ncbi:hypothetical protein JZ751_025674, partial [Albula glossodonta]
MWVQPFDFPSIWAHGKKMGSGLSFSERKSLTNCSTTAAVISSTSRTYLARADMSRIVSSGTASGSQCLRPETMVTEREQEKRVLRKAVFSVHLYFIARCTCPPPQLTHKQHQTGPLVQLHGVGVLELQDGPRVPGEHAALWKHCSGVRGGKIGCKERR